MKKIPYTNGIFSPPPSSFFYHKNDGFYPPPQAKIWKIWGGTPIILHPPILGGYLGIISPKMGDGELWEFSPPKKILKICLVGGIKTIIFMVKNEDGGEKISHLVI